MEKVRIGVVGPSWWFDFWHLPAIQNHPEAELSAICSARPRSEEDAAQRYGKEAACYTDRTRMMENAALDGVIVCTPNDLHYPVTMEALKHNLPVLCEKPVALNAEQAREMARTAAERNLLAMSSFPYRGNPAILEFRRLVKDGYLGLLIHVSAEYHGAYGLDRPPNWRGSRSRSGSGILGDLGSHLIDLVRFTVCQEFVSVCSNNITLLRDPQTGVLQELISTEDPRAGDRNDDSCMFLALLSGGAQAMLHTSWVALQGEYWQTQEIEAYGTEGRLRFSANHLGTGLWGMKRGEKRLEAIPVENIVTPDSGQPPSQDNFRPGRGASNSVTWRWIDSLLKKDHYQSPSLQDGYITQLVSDAVLSADRTGAWVEIENM